MSSTEKPRTRSGRVSTRPLFHDEESSSTTTATIATHRTRRGGASKERDDDGWIKVGLPSSSSKTHAAAKQTKRSKSKSTSSLKGNRTTAPQANPKRPSNSKSSKKESSKSSSSFGEKAVSVTARPPSSPVRIGRSFLDSVKNTQPLPPSTPPSKTTSVAGNNNQHTPNGKTGEEVADTNGASMAAVVGVDSITNGTLPSLASTTTNNNDTPLDSDIASDLGDSSSQSSGTDDEPSEEVDVTSVQVSCQDDNNTLPSALSTAAPTATATGITINNTTLHANAMPMSSTNSSGLITSTSQLPSQFDILLPGKFFGSAELLRNTLHTLLSPYGIQRLVLGPNSHLNHNPDTKTIFPHRRFNLICGSCNTDIRDKDSTENGCCGFRIVLLLVTDASGESFLEVRKFELPPTSRHLLISHEDREAAESKVITNENMLTPRKTKFLKSMGKNRAKGHTVVNMLADQFDGLQVGPDLMYRVMKKGRDEAWGVDDDESMTILYAQGLKLREYNSKYGVHGKFSVRTCHSSGKLISWLEQTPLEVLNARIYAKDAYWLDTTHNATAHKLKTGPLSCADWGGLTAPSGLIQVPEEEIEVVRDRLILLEHDAPGSTGCTDGGAAWPAILEAFEQEQAEDTHHNAQNAIKKAKSITNKRKKRRFKKLRSQVLYEVMDKEKLPQLFAKMREAADGQKGVINWIDRIEDGKEVRTATYTSERFICSVKGCTSRCEVSMTKLKNAGTNKAAMKNWTLPELQNRHRQLVESYEAQAMEEIKEAIKEKRVFSHYVLDKEKVELEHVPNLEIVSITADVVNPFHGVQQSSKKTVAFCLTRPSKDCLLGLFLTFVPFGEERVGARVDSIAESSVYAGTELRAGMIIHTVNRVTFSSQAIGLELLTSVEGRFTVFADTLPKRGTVYVIRRKSDKKEQHTVFIPDAIPGGDNLHCQSSFHMHTGYWIRDRYSQRALMEHPSRSMKDESTMHVRWHINTSPLYNIALQNMISLMEIDGLGDNSLPDFLSSARQPRPANEQSSQSENVDDDKPIKWRAPSTKGDRYNAANTIAGRIVDMAEMDMKVYEMVMPQLHAMYNNCVLIRGSKSKKVANAKSAVSKAQVAMPVVPEALRGDKGEEVNHANMNAKKGKSKGKGKGNVSKKKGSQKSTAGGSSSKKRKASEKSEISAEDYAMFLQFQQFQKQSQASNAGKGDICDEADDSSSSEDEAPLSSLKKVQK